MARHDCVHNFVAGVCHGSNSAHGTIASLTFRLFEVSNEDFRLSNKSDSSQDPFSFLSSDRVGILSRKRLAGNIFSTDRVWPAIRKAKTAKYRYKTTQKGKT
jgi:hypothetical protein